MLFIIDVLIKMDEIEIKHEYDSDVQDQCYTCLSVNRKLKPIGEYIDVFRQIVTDLSLHVSNELDLKVCWECESLLKKIVKFQSHVHKANEMRQLGQNYINGTLSTLTTVITNDTHSHTIYFTETYKPTDKKAEIDMNIKEIENDSDRYSDNDNMSEMKIKKEIKTIKTINNRWARKRASQNKKPKFKIVTNSIETFKQVNMTDEEMRWIIREERDKECYKTMSFKCVSCVKGFNKECLYVKHNKQCHLQNRIYVCDVCETRFAEKRHLSAHIRRHYCKYICTLCNYVCYNKRNTSLHTQREHRNIFQCMKCDRKFGYRREFFRHFKEWHEKFICDYCGISFKMRYCIKDHIRKQHSPFECKECNKRFARYNGLWLHNKTRHSAPAAAAYCVECDKRYVDVYRYKWHLANSAKHTPRARLRIPCPSCEKVFSKHIYMKDHYNLVHLKYYKYRCEECDKNFIRNADLVKHRRRVHEGILPPKNKICYMCGRGFTTNKILTNHLRTHTGERPFACECGARFAQSSALTAHSRALQHNTK